MALANNSQDDRREFFRINDAILLDYSPITRHEAEQVGQRIKSPFHSGDSDEHSQLRALQTAFTHLTDQINQHDREVARALRLLDEKINLIAHAVQKQQNNSMKSEAVEANLSGGGLAFLVSEEIPAKTPIEVQITLRPSGTRIHAIANVISCAKTHAEPKHTPYLLRLVFTHMSEVDRNLLVKHTLSRQAEELRRSRDLD